MQPGQRQTHTDISWIDMGGSGSIDKGGEPIFPGSNAIQRRDPHARPFIGKAVQFRLKRIEPWHKHFKTTIFERIVVPFYQRVRDRLKAEPCLLGKTGSAKDGPFRWNAEEGFSEFS